MVSMPSIIPNVEEAFFHDIRKARFSVACYRLVWSRNDSPRAPGPRLSKDLMVRSEGGRHQAVTGALVAAIWTPPADSDRRPSDLEAYYELPYYDSATGAGRFVAFRSAQTVQLWVLDLCVYRDDGAAVHTVGQNVPPNVIPAWKRHHEKVTEIAEKALNKYRTVEEFLRDKSVGGDKRDLILKRMIP